MRRTLRRARQMPGTNVQSRHTSNEPAREETDQLCRQCIEEAIDDDAAKALKALLSTPTYQEHARKIQAQIMQEDGVAALCAAVEQVLRDF